VIDGVACDLEIVALTAALQHACRRVQRHHSLAQADVAVLLLMPHTQLVAHALLSHWAAVVLLQCHSDCMHIWGEGGFI